MKKQIFINDQNSIVECGVYLDESQIRTAIAVMDDDKAEEGQLVDLGQKLLEEDDKLELSQTIRDLSDFNPEIDYTRMYRHHLLDAIVLDTYDFNSALLNEKEMDNLVFLRKLRNLLVSLKQRNKSSEMQYVDSFKQAIEERTSSLESPKKIRQYRKVMAKQLPYTKK